MFQRQKTMWEKAVSLAIVISFIAMPINSYATAVDELPTGWDVQDGSATFDTSTLNTLDVNQSTNTVIINYDSFSIGSDATVNFDQPTVESWALNRVTGGSASEIFGTLNANGRIFLINSNGKLLAPGSSVNAAGLVLSSLDITNENFIEGATETGLFDFNCGESCGAVINHGAININQPGGFAVLLGSGVLNTGTIVAETGTVALAAGKAITVNLDRAGLISAVINTTVGTDENVENLYAAVNNKGTITANGGKVVLTADVVGDIFDSSVNNDGIIEAAALDIVDGNVFIRGNQNVELNGTIVASDTIDAYADGDMIIGAEVGDLTIGSYSWEYVGDGGREFLFTEFGFYYIDGYGDPVPIFLIQDDNIGLGDSGEVVYMGESPAGVYADFFNIYTDEEYRWFEAPELNGGDNHVEITGDRYAWEDDASPNWDEDFDDAILDFIEGAGFTVSGADPLLQAQNIFLTSAGGEIIQHSTQPEGSIFADNLMLSANNGISGVGGNGGLATRVMNQVMNLSAVNNFGDIRVSNTGDLTITDLSGITRPSGSSGYNGVYNEGVTIDIEAHSDIDVDAPVINNSEDESYIYLTASEDINVNITNILAQVSSYGNAEIYLSAANNIVVDFSNIEATVEEDGYAEVNLQSTDGTVDIVSSVLNSDVGGDGSAYVYGYSNHGDLNITDSTITANVSGDADYYNDYEYDQVLIDLLAYNNLTVDPSFIHASVGGSGYASTWLYTYYGDVDVSGTAEEHSEISATVNGEGDAWVWVGLENGDGYDGNTTIAYTDILAQVGSGEADVEIYGANGDSSDGDVTISDSKIEALVDGYGEAEVIIEAYSSDECDDYDRGDVNITDSTILAQIGSGEFTALIDIAGANVTLDDTDATAEVLGEGSAYVYISAHGADEYNYWEDEYDWGYAADYGNGQVNILNGSNVLAEVESGDNSAGVCVWGGDILVDDSTVTASVLENGRALVGLFANGGYGWESIYVGGGYDPLSSYRNLGNVTISGGSDVEAVVGGEGHAEVNIAAGSGAEGCVQFGSCEGLSYLLEGAVAVLGGGEYEEEEISGGNINIVEGSTVNTESNGPTEETKRTSLIIMLSENDTTIDASSEVSALATGEENLALVASIAGGSIDAHGRVEAIAPDGLAGVGMLARKDIYAGNIETQGTGEFDILDLLEDIADIDLGNQLDYSSGTALLSLMGDITIGNVTTDALFAGALGLDEIFDPDYEGEDEEDCLPGGEGNIYNAEGDISSNFTYLLARNNIGEALNPIATDTSILAGYSFDEGSIYIDQVTDKLIELGLFLPVSYEEEEDEEYGFLGASLAARDGIVSVFSDEADIVINSMIAANGGVFVQTQQGSIYTGTGWNPVVGGDYGEIPCGSECLLMDFPWGDGDYEDMMLSPIMIGQEAYGPNIIAAGYSYLSTPNGTIGVGNPGDAYAGISGQVYGDVDPLIETINGQDGLSLDMRFGPPPGYVNYQAQGAANQVWPLIGPGAEGSTSFENPLLAYVELVDGAHDARPQGYIDTGDPSAGLTLQIGSEIPPPPPPEELVVPYLMDEYIRVYYELTENFRIASIEPATPTDYYAYHPISTTDESAFDKIELDAGAYEYIDGNLNLNDPLAPYFGSDEEEEK